MQFPTPESQIIGCFTISIFQSSVVLVMKAGSCTRIRLGGSAVRFGGLGKRANSNYSESLGRARGVDAAIHSYQIWIIHIN